MKLKTYTFPRGGVHPDEKKLTAGLQITDAPLPQKVVLPLVQHLGCAARPIVRPGDLVKTGQKIAEPGGAVSASVHASISGKVSAIVDFSHPTIQDKKVQSIVIESDGKDEMAEFRPLFSDYVRHSPDELRGAITEAGIVGLGGACFPTQIKLKPPKEKYIDYLIINGCECEPYLTCDDALMREKAREIVEGAKIIAYITEAYQTIIAIEKNKPEAIEIFKKIAFNEPNVSVAPVAVKYPQGAEKQLIKAVTGRGVPSGGLPFEVGVIVQNVATAYAVFEAIKNGIPLYQRVVTLSGDAVKNPGNYRVRLGMLFSDLIKNSGGTTVGDSIKKIIAGGPMMGFAQSDAEVPVVKGTSGILLMSSSRDGNYQPCIRCARCVAVCPMNLMPNFLSIYAEKELYDETADYYANDCIECGCCAYVCPSHRPIVSHIKLSKAYLCSKK